MSTHPDVVIAGGGIIGLAAAWALARGGAAVVVLEAEPAGQATVGQASRAAAGMLAPLAESRSSGPFLETALDSLRRYPDFLDGLASAVRGRRVPLGPGLLRVARSDAEQASLRQALSWQQQTGLPLEWLEGPAARQAEPGLAANVQAAVFSPSERSVDPPALLAALDRACAAEGVAVLTGRPVTGLDRAAERVTGVRTAAGPVSCGRLLVAGGAWSAGIGRWLDVDLPVVPLRGQILALSAPALRLCHTVYAHGGYLVPRGPERVIVGATEEHAGFEARTTAAGLASLLAAATGLVPSLADAWFESAWAGLRPASADGLPLLGPLPGWDNVTVATGHGRNGILLAPVTAELMARHVLDGHSPPAAFSPARFEKTPCLLSP